MHKKEMRPAKIIKNSEKTGCEEGKRVAAALEVGGQKTVFSLLTWIGLMCRYLKTDCKEPLRGRGERETGS